MKLPFFLARRFVAGETLASAFPAVQQLLDKDLFVTMDLLGEHVHDRKQAQAFTQEYVQLVQQLAQRRNGRDANISIKLSMIGQIIDHDFCVANLRKLLTVARQTHTFVRLDMEGSDLTQSTLDIFESVYADYPDHVGVVLQAYLFRTEKDVDRMCELKARVRLCKGAYSEPASIAHKDMQSIRESFRQYMKMLLLHARYPGIATHDDELINATKNFVTEAAIDPNDFEFQMLYGLRTETQQALVDEGYNMRVYVPYGTAWLPYFSRRLRERKENVGFVLKNLFKK
ncbi:MAG: proline dehydrogenase family protein [Rubricoccaceae bacterium]|nr:proline dehydrogenase family protein [Rubricoccaceae bacterium]